jgi:DnaK suppressor protein
MLGDFFLLKQDIKGRTMSKDLNAKIEALGDQEYMSDAQLEIFEEHLKAEQERLIERQLEIKQNSMKKPESISGDEADRAFAIQSSTEFLSESLKNKVMLNSISKALTAIKKGDYGYCIDCGEEIGIKRLINQPAACRDIECETIAESKSKIHPGANLNLR